MVEKTLSSFKRYSLNTDTSLENGFGISLYDHYLIRSGIIDTDKKKENLLQLANQMLANKTASKRKKRLLSIQLNTLETEWELIQQQHLCLSNPDNNRDFQIAHLILPTRFLFYHGDQYGASEFTQKALSKLLKQLNAEAWIIICKWLSEEIERVLTTFHPEDSEEYQLQARLEDFLHEVHSSLLYDLEKEIAEGRATQKEAISKKERQEMFASETAMTKKRERLLVLLQIQSMLLGQIVEGILKIEAMHPELVSLRLKTSILLTLISEENWGRAILLLQLLNEELGILSAVNCDTGLYRTNLAVAIQVAFIETFVHRNDFKALEFCLHWGEQEQSENFQDKVWKNCEALDLKGKGQSIEEIGEIPNTQLLAFLPSSPMIQISNHERSISLFHHDANTQQIISCTPIGRRLLHHMGLLSPNA